VRFLNSVGQKLLFAIALPALLVALIGLSWAWRRTDNAVRSATQTQAVGIAQFVATLFATVEDSPPGTPPRLAHKVVTSALRSNWAAMKPVAQLRILDNQGVVRWSRNVEEEDRPLDEAPALLGAPAGTSHFDAPASFWPWSPGGGGEVVLPLGGVACAGCHTGESTMHAGALQLTVDEPSLRAEVTEVFKRALGSVLAFTLVLIATTLISLRLLLTKKLSRLAHAMRRAEEGDLVVRAPDLGRDEIGQLAKAFNRMLARLTSFAATEIDTQRDLDRARVELEYKEEIQEVNLRLETRVGELQILYDLARTIASTLDLNEVLERISERVPVTLHVPTFSIMLLTQEGVLEVRKAYPANVGSEGMTFSVGEGICGRAAETRKGMYEPDLETSALFKVRNSGERNSGSMLSVPMVSGNELLGVLNFERPEKANFGPDEIEFFTAVADQVALAVQNARLHEKTVALSMTDALTGVPNRRFLFTQLEAELHRAERYDQPLSMLMIDIDHFKLLNDTAGHQAGDAILRLVSQLLKNNVRKVDTLARYGGEEFVVLLPKVLGPEAVDIAEKLRKVIADIDSPLGRTQPTGHITISIGVSTLPTNATEQSRLVDCADSALYASKRGGRNRVTAYAAGMELHPGRERGPNVQQKKKTGETPIVQG
jgi:diguanylate cyclase (GGDEF)-like protein